jgi:hypothetical protein
MKGIPNIMLGQFSKNLRIPLTSGLLMSKMPKMKRSNRLPGAFLSTNRLVGIAEIQGQGTDSIVSQGDQSGTVSGIDKR